MTKHILFDSLLALIWFGIARTVWNLSTTEALLAILTFQLILLRNKQ